jgi:acyl-CoA synthetase (AMP-forming)/AMP-acid ligase II
VTVNPACQRDELAEYCRARLAAEKVPVRWLVTGSFPLTASGKVREDVLRGQLSEG